MVVGKINKKWWLVGSSPNLITRMAERIAFKLGMLITLLFFFFVIIVFHLSMLNNNNPRNFLFFIT